MVHIYTFIVLLFSLLFLSCEQRTMPPEELYELEKEAILTALLTETKAAFARDYKGWKANWVHRSSISKTYMNFVDTTFFEMTGWLEIDDFVRTYLEEHPDPVPPPAQAESVDVKIYGTGAWVSYEIMDEVFGKKRETRLMEKEDGRWKIAGMHTSIYGFDKLEE